MHGYVLARGVRGKRDDHNSKYNFDAIGDIIKLANAINKTNKSILDQCFVFNGDDNPKQISVLQNIWLETDLTYRTGFYEMMECINGYPNGGTIIINDFASLLPKRSQRETSGMSAEEIAEEGRYDQPVAYNMIRSISDSLVSILSLKEPICQTIIDRHPEPPTSKLIASLNKVALAGRFKADRMQAGFSKDIKSAVIPDEKLGHITQYRLNRDDRYEPQPLVSKQV